MSKTIKDHYGEVANLEKYAEDTRLTKPSDGKICVYAKMI